MKAKKYDKGQSPVTSFLPSAAVVKKFLTTESAYNSLSFSMLDMCILIFGFEVAKSSAI